MWEQRNICTSLLYGIIDNVTHSVYASSECCGRNVDACVFVLQLQLGVVKDVVVKVGLNIYN